MKNKLQSEFRGGGSPLKLFCRAFQAFTLAETIITLGVIGIVAAITIPLIINTYRRIAYPMQLKAVYSKLLVAQKTINDEYGTPDEWRFSNYVTDSDDSCSFEIFKRYATELSAISITDTGNYKYETTGLSSKAKMLNGTLAKGVPDWATIDYVFEGNQCRRMQLKSGATVVMFFANTKGGVYWTLVGKKMYAAFMIDINGVSPPNIIGRDIFAFGLKDGNNSIVPYMDDTADCNKQGAGLSCSRKIIQDDWKMNY